MKIGMVGLAKSGNWKLIDFAAFGFAAAVRAANLCFAVTSFQVEHE
jgi:hypothetical protein